MRNALPNASFLGFTGTPLMTADEVTKQTFGDYISTYDFQRAVEDEATVPLYYDARGEKLGIATNDLNEKIAAKLDEFELDDPSLTERLEREMKREYHIITAETRLDKIAADFVEHYTTGWETGKAMLVCIDKVTCVRMHALIEKHWDARIAVLEKELAHASDEQELADRQRQLEWVRATKAAVIVSEEQGEVDRFAKWDLDIKPHRALIKNGFETEDGKRLDVESALAQALTVMMVASPSRGLEPDCGELVALHYLLLAPRHAILFHVVDGPRDANRSPDRSKTTISIPFTCRIATALTQDPVQLGFCLTDVFDLLEPGFA